MNGILVVIHWLFTRVQKPVFDIELVVVCTCCTSAAVLSRPLDGKRIGRHEMPYPSISSHRIRVSIEVSHWPESQNPLYNC